MSTKQQKQDKLATDVAAILGDGFTVLVEDSNAWVEFSHTPGQGPFARVRVALDRWDWRRTVPEDLPMVMADTARQRFEFEGKNPQYTEEAQELAKVAHRCACAPHFPLIGEDDFETDYRPRPAPNADPCGDTTWEFEQAKTQPIEHVWTIVDGDDDLYALAGFHVVNRVGYVVTEVPWASDGAEAVWCHFERDDEDEEMLAVCPPARLAPGTRWGSAHVRVWVGVENLPTPEHGQTSTVGSTC